MLSQKLSGKLLCSLLWASPTLMSHLLHSLLWLRQSGTHTHTHTESKCFQLLGQCKHITF